MIRLNGTWHWLYMAVDPDTNDVLHTKLQPTRNHYTAKDFFRELVEKHDLDNSLFLVDGHVSLHDACRYYSLRFRVAKHGNRNSVERVFREVKRRTQAFSNCCESEIHSSRTQRVRDASATLISEQPTTGSSRMQIGDLPAREPCGFTNVQLRLEHAYLNTTGTTTIIVK